MRELVAAAKAGDKEAYSKLVTAVGPRMYNLAFRLMGNHSDAEDILQEAFVKAFEQIEQLRSPDMFHAWFYRIVVNEARMQFRFKKRWKLVPEQAEDSLQANPDPAARVVLNERDQAVQAALRRLPPEQREVVVLHDIQGVKHEEIASILGVSVGTVWSRLFYARNKLKEILGGSI